MKKILLLIFFLAFASVAWGAGEISMINLPVATSLSDDDNFIIIDNPGGVWSAKRIARLNVGLTVGPASATSGYSICFDGVTGKLLKECNPTEAKTHLGLENVTNESKATMFTSPTFTGTVTIPTPFTLGAVSVTATGTQLNYVDATSSIQTQLDAKIAKSTIVAAGDVLVGTGAATPGVITKGDNNTVFAVNNSGVLGFYDTFTPVLIANPPVDDTYSATNDVTLVAGETLAQWDVVYCQPKAGVHACYKYDSDATDKLLIPEYYSTAAPVADASGIFLVEGIVRNDGWAQTTNQDEGKPVFASTTAGGITLTEPITAAAEKVVVGKVLEENKIHFRKPVHYPILTGSFVIPAPAATDDINIMKAPRALYILSGGTNCIVQGTTSVTGQLQRCNSDGTSCTDLDSDIVCDADGAQDDGTLGNGTPAAATIAAAAWLRWKTTSVSGTPTFLTVTFKYRTVGE